MSVRKPDISFPNQLALTTAAVVAVAVFVMSLVYTNQAISVTEELTVEHLDKEARLLALHFKEAHAQMHRDALFLSRTPPIEGIIRSARSGGQDPLDGSTMVLWRQRLGRIFVSHMGLRPSYTQLRYIGLNDQGRELVRVNRALGGPVVVAEERLQQKLGEPYIAASLELKPGEVHYSEVTCNREHGRDLEECVPTTRVVVPVFAEGGELFGFIVINAQYEQLLADVFKQMAPEGTVCVMNQSGDYMLYERRGAKATLHMRGADLAPFGMERLLGDATQVGVEDKEALVRTVRIDLEEAKTRRFFFLTLAAPRDVLLAKIGAIQRWTVMVGLLVLLIGCALVWWVAQQVSRPLMKMTRQLRRRGAGAESIDLPLERDDEVGELALAFDAAFKQVQAAARSEERLKKRMLSIIHSAPDGIISIDPQGRVVLFNPACELIFGYRAEEVVGQNVKMLMPALYRSEHDGYLSRYRETGEKHIINQRREVEGLRRDGSTFPMYLNVSEVVLDGEPMFTAVIQDITERKQMEEALVRSNEELESFASAASHDLRSPLRGVKVLATWLGEDLKEHMDEEHQENMELLINRVERMERLLSDLLEYARVGSQKILESGEQLSAEALVRDVVATLSPPEGFEVVLDASLGGVELHRMPAYQVFHNLINNAIKHHPDKGQGQVRVQLSTGAQGEVVFAVKDNGAGIPPRHHARVFEMLQTLRPRDEVEGSGMGLALVKKIVEKQGGELGVESSPGEGATFWFSWPGAKRVGAAA